MRTRSSPVTEPWAGPLLSPSPLPPPYLMEPTPPNRPGALLFSPLWPQSHVAGPQLRMPSPCPCPVCGAWGHRTSNRLPEFKRTWISTSTKEAHGCDAESTRKTTESLQLPEPTPTSHFLQRLPRADVQKNPPNRSANVKAHHTTFLRLCLPQIKPAAADFTIWRILPQRQDSGI